MNGELPKGWVWTSLGEVTENPQYGWTTRATTEGNVHLLRTTDITSGKIDWSSVPYCEEEPENIEKYLLKDGDIVISRAGSVGYSYLLENPQNSIFASYLIRFKPIINNFFLSYFLKSSIYWEAISEKSIGIAMANVNASKLKQIEVPLPPLAEQQRIVNKIEELFTNLDKGIESLKQVKYKLKIYRQAILKYAMEGKLTEKWREENKDKIDFFSYKSEESNDKLPKNWVWTSLENIVDILDNRRIPINAEEREKRINNKDESQLYPYYGSTGQVGWIDEYIFDEELILLGEDGAPFLDFIKDKAYLINGKSWVNNHAHVLRAIKDISVNPFICYYLNSFDYRKYITGTTRYKLNQSQMKKIIVPLPPLEEQHKIVEHIEQLFSLADYIEETVGSKLEQSKTLRQSILKKAFEGKLVPQDPNDEPAELLLEKIKKQRLNKEELVQEKLV